MAQNDFVDRFIKKNGRKLDFEEKTRKREARKEKLVKRLATNLTGIKAKLFAKKRYSEKIQLKREQKIRESKLKSENANTSTDPLPHFLLDREDQENARSFNEKIKQKRQEKAAKFNVPLPKIQPLPESEVFGVVTSGKRGTKHWKRIVNKATFVGNDFTRKPPKYERFIRPMALRYKKAHVAHPELNSTFYLEILGIKTNPHSDVYTSLGVLTKGTIIEVNVSELGMVDKEGKIIWGKYAQITNNPEYDGAINAVLLV